MYNCCSVYNPPSGGGGSGTVSGTLNYVAKFTPNGTSVGNSQIFERYTKANKGVALHQEEKMDSGNFFSLSISMS